MAMKWLIPFLLLLSAAAGHAQPFIQKADALQDLSRFVQQLEEMHYNPWMLITQEKFSEQQAAFAASLDDSVALPELIDRFYQLCSGIQDGHTMPALVQPAFKAELGKPVFFPVKLVREQQRLYIPRSAAKASGIPEGSRILFINDLPAAELLGSMDGSFGGTAAYKAEMTIRLFPYLLRLKGVRPPFRIQYENPSGGSGDSVITEGLSFRNALALNLPAVEQGNTFRIISNRLGWLSFTSMSGNLDAFDHYLDSCVRLMQEKNIRHWAIDLRDNSGGNSLFAELLISYFHTGNYTLMGKRKWKISEPYKTYLRQSGDTSSEYLLQANGRSWETGNCQSRPPRFVSDRVFTGRVYLLTGPFTFSSANMLADGAKHFKMATLIGSETGENTHDFGEAYQFELPASRIRMQITTSFDYGVNCQDARLHPVEPDIPFAAPLVSRIAEEDALLSFLLKQIPEQQPEK